ncbi:MAG: molybdopterin/thiamine biosynthesis adenylyltransferase/rhodanese-related sulfurtransferase [Algoriphagus sp.]|jgi:molybdopterin/thiamine biosynthesis adenylyltransferase/rhodanese-related sulfurtransferase
MELSKEELHRYSRQVLIPEFGLEGQKRLKESSVLVIGCGGLGSPILMYLAAAGVGRIGIVEDDNVELTNLQRQVLYSGESVGKPKIEEAKKRIESINHNIEIETHFTRLTSNNALEIIEKYDLIVDGSDNFPTRYLVNDACVLKHKPFVYGAIYRFEGQVSVFNYKGGPTYRELFPIAPSAEMAPNCGTAGVLGMMAGIVGSLQATEVIKILTGLGQVLSGKLLIIEALSMNFRKVSIQRNSSIEPIMGLIDYEAFCSYSEEELKSISYREFLRLKAIENVQLIDVREASEYELYNIGGELMPLSELGACVNGIKQDKTKVVIHCQSGLRSRKAIKLLSEKYGLLNLFNLEGGLMAVDA